MARYTFTCQHFNYNDFNGDEQNVASMHTTQFRADDLTTMLENFEMFLRGAGFQFDGHLDVVSYESEIDKIDRELDELREESRSQRVFDHIVKDIQNNPISFKSEKDFVVNLDNMNTSFVAGAIDDAGFSNFSIDESIDISQLSGITISTLNSDPVFSEQYSFDFSEDGKCEVCGLPKSVMSIHRCYDDNCPIYAVKP